MSAQYGGNLLLKIGDGGSPEAFIALGGVRLTRLRTSQQMLNASTLESLGWRSLQAEAGTSSVTLSAEGAFTDAASEAALRAKALTGAATNWQLRFPNGDTLTGPFLVSHYERSGDMLREEEFAVTLESAGALVYAEA